MAWAPRFYGSGTCNVEDMSAGNVPYLYVMFCNDESGRMQMCVELAAWLNGEAGRPLWLDDMELIHDKASPQGKLLGSDGSFVEPCGPSYDADPPSLFWKRCEKPESVAARTALLERLLRVAR